MVNVVSFIGSRSYTPTQFSHATKILIKDSLGIGGSGTIQDIVGSEVKSNAMGLYEELE
jgi:hypothetical protein